jgi:hypothetical protein
MQRTASSLVTAVAAVSLLLGAAVPARADDFGSRFTLSVAPNFQVSTAGDQAAGPPAGFSKLGYTNDNANPQTLQLDYGLDFKIDKVLHLFYEHSNFDYALGRILTVAPHVSLTTGILADRQDTIGLQRGFGHGLVGQIYYFNKVRADVSGLCLNQESCTSAQLGGTQGGAVTGNPSSIDDHGYGLHGGYSFGPKTRLGQPFTLGVDAQYIPRPSIAPTGEAANLGGLGSYVGSQWLFPYSLTVKIPIFPDPTIIPLAEYERADVLYRAEATPEVYNLIAAGIVKVINKNATLSILNVHLNGCKCADTVPPPDNVRISVLEVKLDLHTGL